MDPKLKEYAEAVRAMRAIQKRFFGGERTRDIVGEAKRLERRVDELTADLLAAPASQTKLPGLG